MAGRVGTARRDRGDGRRPVQAVRRYGRLVEPLPGIVGETLDSATPRHRFDSSCPGCSLATNRTGAALRGGSRLNRELKRLSGSIENWRLPTQGEGEHNASINQTQTL